MNATRPPARVVADALRSLRILGAMGRVTANILADLARTGGVERAEVDAQARWFASRLVRELDIDLHVTGREHLDAGSTQTYLFVGNHQSLLDPPIVYAALPEMTLRMVGKRELFAIPLWGRALRAAEYIEINRANHAQARASIERAAALLRSGVNIFMAPEGTRSRDGRIGPLKKGAFHLAKDTATPIVPIAIDGTGAILPRDGFLMRQHRQVRITIGKPMPPPTDATMAACMQSVREFYVAHVPPHLAAG